MLLPPLWFWGFRSLAGLGAWRRVAALLARSLVLTLLVAALAEVQLKQKNDRLTVLFLLDQSYSIPEPHRAAMVRYVNAAVRRHRRDEKGDHVGVIVFGRDAKVELPPVDFDFELATRVETDLDEESTNLQAALERAMAVFPPDTSGRVVVVTDGNENVGNALRQARAMAARGVSIDVLPVPITPRAEVSVDKVVAPAEARRDQPFDLRVVLGHQPAAGGGGGSARGKLRITRSWTDADGAPRETTLSESPVELPPGKRVFTLTETIDQPSSYTYSARFIPDTRASDASTRNNTASGFTYVRGKGRVLLIEDYEHRGEFAPLVSALRREGLLVTLQPSNRTFTTLAELQNYDSVLLANVPRSSGFGGETGGVDTDRMDGFTDAQIAMLARNTEELGCGLVMLGGDRSFGAGGWAGTELEEALPVDMRIKAAEVTPVGALALMMHAAEISKANYWQKVIAREAIGVLGPRDYCGLIQWSGSERWLWSNRTGGMLPVGPNRGKMMAAVDRLTVGDMPDFDPGMKKIAGSMLKLRNPTPAIKHCIVISDGDPAPPTRATMRLFTQQGIRITTVAVGGLGGHGDLNMMQKLASQTGGKYYQVKNARALPRIYQREARRVAQPVVRELEPAVSPRVVADHEVLTGIPPTVPAITGFVQTALKDSSLVEVVLRSPAPPNQQNATVLATWTYGLGKTAAFTTDCGHRWANRWTGWAGYDQFFGQLVRWSMRPTGDTAGYSVATEVKDGKTRVIVDALDKNDEFINARAMTGAAVAPGLGSKPLFFEQKAPGRYEAVFDSPESGAYLLSINPGGGQAIIRTGVNVGYSDEFRDRQTNRPLLEQIAGLAPERGKPGKVIDQEAGVELPSEDDLAPGGDLPDPLLAVDPYRRDMAPPISRQDIWPVLVLASCLTFFADVFIRRVQFGFDWVKPASEWVAKNALGRRKAGAPTETMNRLRSRKAEVRQQTSQRKSIRYEAPDDADASESPLLDQPITPTDKPKPQTSGGMAASKEQKREESYTERLLKAKQQSKRDRDE